MESQQSPSGGDGDNWRELVAQYELVQMATGLAFQALVEAYRPGPDGHISEPPAELLMRYKNACALRMAAEQALLRLLESRVPPE